MKLTWRAWAALLLSVVLLAGLLPAAAEAPEAEPGKLAVVYKLANQQDGDESFRAAFRTLLTPLVLDAVDAQRDVALLYVDGQTYSKAQKVTAATMQAEISEAVAHKSGSSSQLQTNLGNNIQALSGPHQQENMQGVTELWFVQNYPMFAVGGTGTTLKAKDSEAAKIIGHIGTLLKLYPDMTLNLVWFGQSTPESDEILFDGAVIRAALSEYAQRINVYVIDPEQVSAAVSTDLATPVGLVRNALGLAVPAPAVQAEKGADGVFQAVYTHVNDQAAWLHITTDGAEIDQVALTGVETAEPLECRIVIDGDAAWALVPGAACGDQWNVRVTTKAGAVTVQGYAPAETIEASAVGEPASLLSGMQNKSATLRMQLTTRALTKDMLNIQITAHDGQETYAPDCFVEEETVDGKLCLAITTSELRVGDGTLTVELSVKDAMNQSVLPALSVPYHVDSEAPKFNEARKDEFNWIRFTNLPGKDSPVVKLALDEYFSDHEDETLTYQPEGTPAWRYEAQDRVLYFDNDPYIEGAQDVTVTATDPHGEATSHTFSVTQRDAEAMLSAWRFEAQDGVQQTGRMEQVKQITLTLEGVREDFDELMRQYELTGEFEDCIVVTAAMSTGDEAAVTSGSDLPAGAVMDDTLPGGPAENGLRVAYAAPDGDDISLTLTLPEQTASVTLNITFSAIFRENGMTLPELLPALTVSYGNTAPALLSGAETLLTTESQANDLPGQEVSIPLDTLFASTTVPDELFGDSETADTLVYTVAITGDAAVLYDGGEPREPDSMSDGTSVYVLEPGAGSDKLDVRFIKAGEATIVLTAQDSGGLAAADSVTWQVTLSSLKQLVMLIAAIVAAVVLVLIIIIIVVRIKTRPHFRGTQLVLDTPDGGQVRLKLDYWETHSATLANLAIAAQLAPIAQLPIERLAQITISPARGKNRRFTMKGTGDAESLTTRIGSESTNLRKGFYMGLGQKVVISAKSMELLSVCIQRESGDDVIL